MCDLKTTTIYQNNEFESNIYFDSLPLDVNIFTNFDTEYRVDITNNANSMP